MLAKQNSLALLVKLALVTSDRMVIVFSRKVHLSYVFI